MEFELCCECGAFTGRGGAGEDSLFCEWCEVGPFCEDCFELHFYDDDFAYEEGVFQR